MRSRPPVALAENGLNSFMALADRADQRGSQNLWRWHCLFCSLHQPGGRPEPLRDSSPGRGRQYATLRVSSPRGLALVRANNVRWDCGHYLQLVEAETALLLIEFASQEASLCGPLSTSGLHARPTARSEAEHAVLRLLSSWSGANILRHLLTLLCILPGQQFLWLRRCAVIAQ